MFDNYLLNQASFLLMEEELFQAGQILQFRKPFGTGGYHVSSAYGGVYYFHGYLKVPDLRERFLVLERIDREFSFGGTMFLVNVSEFEVELVRQ